MSNIAFTDQRWNFEAISSSQSDTYGTPYDYRSIMHYAKNAAAIDPKKNVLIPKDKTMLDVIGHAKLPSYWDAYKINKIYECQ